MGTEKHIDPEIMTLYVSGYPFLKQEVINFIQTHLRQCSSCKTCYIDQLEKANIQTSFMPEMKTIPNLDFIKSTLNFIQRQISNPQVRQQIQHTLSCLTDVLREYFEDTQEQSFLTMEGYGFPLSSQEKGEHKDNNVEHSMLEDQLTKIMHFIFRALTNERIPMAQRIELANQLMNLINQYFQKIQGEEGIAPSNNE